MNKTRTVGQKWLANQLDLQFLTVKKCTKAQSNRSILSKFIVYTGRQTSRETDRPPSKIPFFLTQGTQNVDMVKKNGGGANFA